jgi:hypothetical protein
MNALGKLRDRLSAAAYWPAAAWSTRFARTKRCAHLS